MEEVDSTEYDHACWVELRFTTSTEPLGLIAEAEDMMDTTDNVTDGNRIAPERD
ncbi:MAG: hypothetical protein ACLS8R_05205 [Anaeromassilibacillus sp.]